MPKGAKRGVSEKHCVVRQGSVTIALSVRLNELTVLSLTVIRNHCIIYHGKESSMNSTVNLAVRHLGTTLFGVALAAGAVANAQTDAPQTKLGGFVDAQYKWQKNQDLTTGAVINDGAIYLSHSTGGSELVIDLPFAFGVTTDSLGSPIYNALILGTSKSQAYIAHSFGQSRVQLGQFDTIYGVERNDAPDIFFTNQGILFSRMTPRTHTGALLSHAIGQMNVKLLAANSTAGIGDTGAQLEGKGEYGASLEYADATFRAAVGYLTGRIVTLPGESRNFTDLRVGTTMGRFDLDVEYSFEKIASNDQGTGLAVLPVYRFSDHLALGVRFEQLNKVAPLSADPLESEESLTIGLQHRVNDALVIKTDFTELKKNYGSTTEKDQLWAFSAVYKF
jgi:hypothetical protein